MSIEDIKRIGNICNYYGGLSVKAEGLKYYWSIKDYTGHNWKEIPYSLYKDLIKYENTRIKNIELAENNETI